MTISYHDTVTPAIEEALALLRDCAPILEEFAVWHDGYTDDMFRSETDPYGRPWADLTSATWKKKHKGGSINKKLQWDGTMRASVVSQVSKNSFRHGFADQKAVFHDRGTRKMRRRQLLPDAAQGLPKAVEKELGAIALRWIVRTLN